jgi:hypothetical protein
MQCYAWLKIHVFYFRDMRCMCKLTNKVLVFGRVGWRKLGRRFLLSPVTLCSGGGTLSGLVRQYASTWDCGSGLGGGGGLLLHWSWSADRIKVVVLGFPRAKTKICLTHALNDLAEVSSSGRLHRRTPVDTSCLEIAG